MRVLTETVKELSALLKGGKLREEETHELRLHKRCFIRNSSDNLAVRCSVRMKNSQTGLQECQVTRERE